MREDNNQTISGEVRSPLRIKFPYDKEKFRLELERITRPVIASEKKVEYFDVAASFDIETTSFYDSNDEKTAIMYFWSLDVEGVITYGRTWEEALSAFGDITAVFHTSNKRRVIIYSHLLAMEFQFLRGWMTFSKVFAVDNRKPLYALTDTGLEFRCSYLLSGCKLENIKLHTYTDIAKKVGDLDYSKLRHSETPMTPEEIEYGIYDVAVVVAYIMECSADEGDITHIPLTKTGYVRRYTRNLCLPGGVNEKVKKIRYKRLISSLTLEASEFRALRGAFAGGYTHANAFYVNKTLENVVSFDIASSYPTVMVVEKFPMSKGREVKLQSSAQFRNYLRCYCCLIDITFNDINAKTLYAHTISSSKCHITGGRTIDNGRVVEAERLRTTITEQDYFIIKEFYEWSSAEVHHMWIYRKGYLPTPFIKGLMELYRKKTELKNVEGSEVEYNLAKEMINSEYGMSVTNEIDRELEVYIEGEWKADPRHDPESPEYKPIEYFINKYNNNPGRFLFYPWGVWITAYARRNLFTLIKEFGNDFIYADTDSVKGLNGSAHLEAVEDYNTRIREKVSRALTFHDICVSAGAPLDKNGNAHPLGVFENETEEKYENGKQTGGPYRRFKTLGAKRYLYEDYKGDYKLTVAGTSKTETVKYLKQKYGDRILDEFTNNLDIPAKNTGKLTHTYIDEVRSGYLTDYTGREAHYYERSSIHMEPSPYSFSMADAFLEYINGIRSFDK